MKSDITKIKTMFKHMIHQKNNSAPGKMDSLKAQYPDTVVPTNKKAPQLEGGYSMKIDRMWKSRSVCSTIISIQGINYSGEAFNIPHNKKICVFCVYQLV